MDWDTVQGKWCVFRAVSQPRPPAPSYAVLIAFDRPQAKGLIEAIPMALTSRTWQTWPNPCCST